MADFTIKSGDTQPVLTDTLTLSDGSAVNLTGATVLLVMRSMTAAAPLTLTGQTTVTNPAAGGVKYTPSAADTATPGMYMANWQVTFADTSVMTFPTVGYLAVSIEPNLTSEPVALVSLPDVKDYLTAYGVGVDRSHDAKLARYINAATPLIENIVGPVIVRTFDEWHAGGQYFIQLRRRPSSAIGATPVLAIMACDEYRGPVKYTLSVVPDPTSATIYSVMLEPRTGTVYRRTTGGGVIPFGAGAFGGARPDAVHVIYQAGQQSVPENVREAALEYVRWSYMSTQATGGGSRSIADQEDMAAVGLRPAGLPPSALQLLAPMRKHPTVA